MKKCIITQCMFCDHSRFQEVFEYKQPPIGETDFGLLKSDLYYRKIISCMICGHFYSTGLLFSPGDGRASYFSPPWM